MLKSGVSGSLGRSIPIFLMNSHTDVHTGCTKLQSHNQWISILFTLCLHQHGLAFILLILVIQTVEK